MGAAKAGKGLKGGVLTQVVVRKGLKGGPDPHGGEEGVKGGFLTHMVVRKGLKGVPDPHLGMEGVKGGP